MAIKRNHMKHAFSKKRVGDRTSRGLTLELKEEFPVGTVLVWWDGMYNGPHEVTGHKGGRLVCRSPKLTKKQREAVGFSDRFWKKWESYICRPFYVAREQIVRVDSWPDGFEPEEVDDGEE